ncbi:hypothetical protein C7974DRAFT_379534 [Boeremia exigua]|uniref:uncharacterized protein n=1 Tax=Boeremia exigua TaxID=749465 RepID=UPI001E8E6381|nr:uncharacterized protein C7974DRAFT_379534 [Boeremia exigua]KAH6616668.1 hypothetical protein C7974DRAFT_379534 [Boeremia exigua]
MTLHRRPGAQRRCTGCVVRHKLLASPDAQSNERPKGPHLALGASHVSWACGRSARRLLKTGCRPQPFPLALAGPAGLLARWLATAKPGMQQVQQMQQMQQTQQPADWSAPPRPRLLVVVATAVCAGVHSATPAALRPSRPAHEKHIAITTRLRPPAPASTRAPSSPSTLAVLSSPVARARVKIVPGVRAACGRMSSCPSVSGRSPPSAMSLLEPNGSHGILAQGIEGSQALLTSS